MEVDEMDRDGRANSEDNDTSSIEVVLTTIKALEKQAKTREQQLVGKHEQERLQWEQEKQALLEQLHQKQPPYKVPQSPARPVLGAVTPNKQRGPPSKASQATSDSSFRDVFTSPSAKTHTSISHHVSPRCPISPSRLEAELQAVKKKLARVEYKYQALYKAQEDILRKRNQDRDKWRHFKNVVKTATTTRPDFQLELRKADALIKKQEEDCKNVTKDDVVPNQPSSSVVPGTAVASATTKGSMGSSSLSTPTKKKSYARRTASEAEIQTNEEPKSPSPRKSRQYGARTNGGTEGRRVLVAAPTTSIPIIPTFLPNHASVGLIRSESPFTAPTQAAQPASNTPRPTALVMLPGPPIPASSSQLRKHDHKSHERSLQQQRQRHVDEYFFLEGNMDTRPPDQRHRDVWEDEDFFDLLYHYEWRYLIAVLDIFEMDNREPEDSEFAELKAFEKSEYESDMQVLQRIYAEYEPIPCAKDIFPTEWILDGKELVGPAIAPAAAVGVEPNQDEMQRPPLKPSQPSTVENLSFWSEEGELARSVVESVPTEVEFGSYRPGTADSCCTPAKVSNSEEHASQGEAVASASSQRIISRNSGVAYLYPLPQDLQSRIPQDQDMLEESVPIRRLKAPRLSAFSNTSFTPIQEEKVWKPFESRSRRRLASSNAGSSPPSQAAPTSGAIVTVNNVPFDGSDDNLDAEATEASSSPAGSIDQQQTALAVNKIQNHAITVGQGGMDVDMTPVTSADPRTSTVKCNSGSYKEAVSPTNQADKAQTSSAASVPTDTSWAIQNDAIAEIKLGESSEQEDLDSRTIMQEQLPSYRPSQLQHEHSYAIRKTISDEKIGPRQGSAHIKPTRLVVTLAPATQNYCETILAQVTGKGGTIIKHPQVPLGKPIGVAQLDDTPKRTPPAWHNMSSKRRAPSTAGPYGTPSSATSLRGSDRAISGAKASMAAVIIGTTSAHHTIPEASGNTANPTIKPLRASTATKRTFMDHTIPKKEILSPPKLVSQVEAVANPPKQLKAKRPRRSANMADAEVESDLELVGNAIIRKTGFALGAKRSASLQAIPDEKPSKKSRKSLEGDVLAERSSKKPSSKSTADVPSRRTLEEQKWVQQRDAESKQDKGKHAKESQNNKERTKPAEDATTAPTNFSNDTTLGVKVKAEDTRDQATENSEESEEFLGQRFMRKLHEERRKTMQADPLKSKGRGAYAAQVQAARNAAGPSPVGRSEVAHKETIRGREARQAVHGVNCPCCTGYYEYKTRNLPLEERAKAAAEMVNEVSRHRQNWEAAESPPGYWQMGFPSTAQVERLNEEAVEMKKEKHERQKKEKAIDDNCEGRREYKVV